MDQQRPCMMWWLYILLCAIVKTDCVRVLTSLGELDGGEYATRNGRQVFTFLGVPYARPPVGDDRFKEPRPAKPWSGVWHAHEYSPACIQFNIFSDTAGQIIGNEDCLYLNVYTPKISDAQLLPVLVYFHGGAFTFGEGKLYKPHFLLDKHDIVYVSVNYRLGPFGFLSTEDNVVPGNNGLKDQNIALKWVQDNIAAFGGDPTKVTIAGSSAGGASVHYHLMSPLSRGLFRAGISASGSALMPWAFTENPLSKATKLAAAVGCPTNATDFMVKCLRHRPSQQILSQMELFMPWQFNPFSPFGPVVEKSTRNPFLSEHPYQLLSRGEVYNVPWLASLTTEEGLYPVAGFIDREEILQSLNDDWINIAPHLLDFNYSVLPETLIATSEAIKVHYLKDEKISTQNVNKLVRMVGDRLFDVDMSLAARLQASVSTAPVYFYTFSYRGSISLSDSMSLTKSNFGVSHFDDMYYILAVSGTSLEQYSELDQAMIQTMTNIWASFVKTGQPSASQGTQWELVQRDAASTSPLTHLLIHGPNDMETTKSLDVGNYKFWTSLMFQENKNIKLFTKDEL